jgi:DNA-binding IscR family transcriptional regulator
MWEQVRDRLIETLDSITLASLTANSDKENHESET